MGKERTGIKIDGESVSHRGKNGKSVPGFCIAVFCTAALAAAWWNALLSVFDPGISRKWLYGAVFFVCVAVVFLDRTAGRKMLVLPVAAAGMFLWFNQETVKEMAETAVLLFNQESLEEAGRNTGLSDPGWCALTAAVFSVPLIVAWTMALRIRWMRAVFIATAALPFAVSACVGRFPETASSLLLVSCMSVYAVCGSKGLYFDCTGDKCRPGSTGKRHLWIQFFAAAAVAGFLVGGSAAAGKLLDKGREEDGGFYQNVRNGIRTDIIGGIERAAEKLKGEETDSGKDRKTEETAEEWREKKEEAGPQGESSPQTETENIFNRIPGKAENGADNLKALSAFTPDNSVRFTVVLPEKPEETVYLAEWIGIRYTGEAWEGTDEYEELTSGGERIQSWKGAEPEKCRDYLDSQERLSALGRECGSDSLEETGRRIGDALSSMAVYDTEPGPTPLDQDFAEYFLFENQKGFCVHFATAAALLYRACGYPARYARGYAVPASEFRRTEDGKYRAEADGNMGHAWCQVYDEKTGKWKDMEHTPPGGPEKDRTENRPEKNKSESEKNEKLLINAFAAVSGAAAFAAVIFLQSRIRLGRMRRRMKGRTDGRGILAMYENILKIAEFQASGEEKKAWRKRRQKEGLTETALDELKRIYPELTRKEWDFMYSQALKAMFYYPDEEKNTVDRMHRLYRKFVKISYERSGTGRKLLWKYILCLG